MKAMQSSLDSFLAELQVDELSWLTYKSMVSSKLHEARDTARATMKDRRRFKPCRVVCCSSGKVESSGPNMFRVWKFSVSGEVSKKF